MLRTLSLCLIVVKNFVLPHLVELNDLVLLVHYLFEVLQLFLFCQGASDFCEGLLHLIDSLIVRMGLLLDVLLLPVLCSLLTNL